MKKMAQNIFDQIAEKYDSPKQQVLAKVIRQEIEKEWGTHSDKRVLDFGCGTGLISLPFAGKVKQLFLVDVSSEMTKITQEKITQQGLLNTTVLTADFLQELPTFKVDTILVSLVLLHIPQTAEILQHLADMLTERGQLIIVDFDKNPLVYHERVHNGFEQTMLQQMLSKNFSKVHSRTFYEGNHLFMNQAATMFILHAEKN
jgi:ubiquinone/menaquinone biosynthesis C-methylase UbiE